MREAAAQRRRRGRWREARSHSSHIFSCFLLLPRYETLNKFIRDIMFLQHKSTVCRVFSGKHPEGPRNKCLAHFLLKIPYCLPPYVNKAFPRKGWVLLSDGNECVFVCIGSQNLGERESRRVEKWCRGQTVSHIVSLANGRSNVRFLNNSPSLSTKIRWIWQHVLLNSQNKDLKRRFYSLLRTPALPYLTGVGRGQKARQPKSNPESASKNCLESALNHLLHLPGAQK